MEELQQKHRKEQRDLQSKITQKKKQASKKTRKGVNEECERLEAELNARQEAEITTLDGGRGTEEAPTEEVEEQTLVEEELAGASNDHIANPSDATLESGDALVPSQLRKPSRQKARLARRVAEQEDQVRLASEEAQTLPDLKAQERQRMLATMQTHGLQEKEIRADGHCLYSAIADQLEQLEIPLTSAPGEKAGIAYKTVRSAAADYIERNPDDFEPFLEEPLPGYLHKIRETGEWGGQLELMALAKSYGVNINVLQDHGRVEKIEGGEGKEEKIAWLGYYKHGFGLGEHYNSLRSVG